MTANRTWSALGPKWVKPRPNLTFSALAIIFAAQTFVPVEGEYPFYMVVIAWLSAAWATWVGYQKRAWVAAFAVPVSLLWLNPLLGGSWLDEVGIEFLLVHSAIALLYALYAYTFLASERIKK
jgi:hypothetical protein